MIDNLINTWAVLAPGEWPDFGDLNFNIYIQNCINNRGWSWGLICNMGVRFIATVENGPETYPYPTPTDALLTAYLTALAVRRPIKQGTHWRHYKGDLVEVVATAKWAGKCLTQQDIKVFPKYISAVEDFLVEENCHFVITLIKDADGQYHYIAPNDFGKRVFYNHEEENWSRPIGDFLGLTQDGQLRFVEDSYDKP
jgi:hypothetical protein